MVLTDRGEVEARRIEDIAEHSGVGDHRDRHPVGSTPCVQVLADVGGQIRRRRVEMVLVVERQEVPTTAREQPERAIDLGHLVEIRAR